METIREQFEKACIEVAYVIYGSSNKEKMEIAGKQLSDLWINNNSPEFQMFKLGHKAGREEDMNRTAAFANSISCDPKLAPKDDGKTYVWVPALPSTEDE